MNPSAGKFSIGLTGGIGSGKTTVAELFAARGAAVIDTDAIAHQLTQPDGRAMPAIRAQFGDAFILTNGAMDRAKMRQHVFDDARMKKQLEEILHPLIREEVERQTDTVQGTYPVFVVPLLVESGTWRQRVSRILVVDCSEQRQIERVMQRNGMDERQVRAIMANQATRAARLAVADDIIVNEDDASLLAPQIACLDALYRSFAKTGE